MFEDECVSHGTMFVTKCSIRPQSLFFRRVFRNISCFQDFLASFIRRLGDQELFSLVKFVARLCRMLLQLVFEIFQSGTPNISYLFRLYTDEVTLQLFSTFLR